MKFYKVLLSIIKFLLFIIKEILLSLSQIKRHETLEKREKPLWVQYAEAPG